MFLGVGRCLHQPALHISDLAQNMTEPATPHLVLSLFRSPPRVSFHQSHQQILTPLILPLPKRRETLPPVTI